MSDTITGILKRIDRQFVVRTADRSYRKGQVEIMVSPELARQYAFSEGAAVTGQVERKNGAARVKMVRAMNFCTLRHPIATIKTNGLYKPPPRVPTYALMLFYLREGVAV